jgi:hypothetical protein
MAAPKRRWGFTESEWADARCALEQLLAEAGRSRTTVTYGEVARRALGGRVSARSSALMDLLGEVDSAADARLGVMVASLVVRADSGMPGDGYFAFAAEELGRPIGDREAFWTAEVERVWNAYAAEAAPGAADAARDSADAAAAAAEEVAL